MGGFAGIDVRFVWDGCEILFLSLLFYYVSLAFSSVSLEFC
jgi:hypothetical protein